MEEFNYGPIYWPILNCNLENLDFFSKQFFADRGSGWTGNFAFWG
jgi:hypothetical protein